MYANALFVGQAKRRFVVQKYTPNFENATVKARCHKVLTYLESHISTDKTHWISRVELYKHYGNTSRPLGQWLLQTTLTEQDSHWNYQTGQCKKYRKNTQGVKHLKQCLKGEWQLTISPDLDAQLQSGEIVYETKSHRQFTPLQFIEKRYRKGILTNHGYRYHYDITAAAPTLLMQKATQLDSTLELPHLKQYTNNRSELRQLIAKQTSTTPDRIKLVINAVLQGAVLSVYPNNKLFMELDFDYDLIKRLQTNTSLSDIRKDITTLWRSLRDQFEPTYITTKTGQTRRSKLSGKEKSGYYRELELDVGKTIQRYLKKNNTRYLWIHDGWCCDKAIDPNWIVSEVRRQTGFVIELDMTIYEE